MLRPLYLLVLILLVACNTPAPQEVPQEEPGIVAPGQSTPTAPSPGDGYPAPTEALPTPTRGPYPPPTSVVPTLAPYPEDQTQVWILRPMREQQCTEDGSEVPPTYPDLGAAVAALQSEGIEVTGSGTVGLVVCEACECPSSEHYRLRIPQEDLEAAVALGWQPEE